MTYLDERLTQIEGWYRQHIPARLGSRNFIDFVIHNQELARQISDKPLQFRADIPTACTDGENIWMPATYLIDVYFDELGIEPQDQVLAAIACINGSQVHESLHCRLTNCKMDEAIQLNPKAVKYAGENQALMFSIMNIVEDLYIERWCKARFPQLYDFILSKNAILFGERHLDEVKERLQGAELTKGQWLQQAVMLKDRQIHDTMVPMLRVPQAPNLVEDLLLVDRCKLGDPGISDDKQSRVDISARDEQYKERLAVAIKFYEAIMASDLLDDPTQEDKSDQTIDGGEGGGSDAENAATQATPSSMQQAAANSANHGIEENKEHNRVKIHRQGGQIDLSRIGPVQLTDVLEFGLASQVITPDRKWLQLGRSLRYARSINHVQGRPRDVGSSIISGRLAHIAIDGKVLAHRDATGLTRGVPELIILIDSSGSMVGNQVGSRTLLQVVTEAAYGGFLSMLEARLPVAVYAHSTGSNGGKPAPIVAAIAANEMPLTVGGRATTTGDHARRFAALRNMSHSSNMDGIALDYCLHRFTNKPGTKLMMVLSDGQPNGSWYDGAMGIRHTAIVADDARRRGIHVVCGSLVEDVVDDNDEIYGKDFNIIAYGNNLGRAIQQVVSHLAVGASA